MTDTERDERDEYDLDDTQRRQFLALLASEDGVLQSMTESGGRDVTPMAIRAMAVELCKVSIGLEVELRDKLAELEQVMEAFGALAAGFMGFGEYEPEEGEEPEGVQIKTMFRHIGFDIREGALA